MYTDKTILSMTLNQLINVPTDRILIMLEEDLEHFSDNDEYSSSIAVALVKRILLIKSFAHQYDKFYKIITSKEFRKNKNIYDNLDNINFVNLRKFVDLYNDNDNDKRELMDYIFVDNENLFSNLVLSKDCELQEVFSKRFVNYFNKVSFRTFLLNSMRSDDKNRVIKALLREKNDRYIYLVAKMDDIVLRFTDDDSAYFETVVSLLNYNNYRRLLWDYYHLYVGSNRVEAALESDKLKREIPEQLRQLLDYSFRMMSVIYSNEEVQIIGSISELADYYMRDKDVANINVFGEVGYKKVKEGNFDVKIDWPKIYDDNQLLNFKLAFLKMIYGLTYHQAEKLVFNFNNFVDKFGDNEGGDVFEILMAIKTLLDLNVSDEEEIDVYRRNYYEYISKEGINAMTSIGSMTIIEKLMHEVYEDEIEVL